MFNEWDSMRKKASGIALQVKIMGQSCCGSDMLDDWFGEKQKL